MLFENLKNYLKKEDLIFQEDEEEENCLNCGFETEDLTILLTIDIVEEDHFMIVRSYIPVETDEKYADSIIWGLNFINNSLVKGCFQYFPDESAVTYRDSTHLSGNIEMDEAAFESIISDACLVIDQFNDKIALLSKGVIDLEQFLQMSFPNDIDEDE